MSEVIRKSLKKAVKGTAFVFASMVISILIWFADRVIVVRNTTMEEMGLYSMAIAIASVVSSIAILGLHEGAPRYISVFLGEGREEDARKVTRTSLRMGLVSGLVVSALMYLMAGPVAERVFYMQDLARPLRVISLFPLLYVLVGIMVGIVRGYGDVKPRVYFVNIGQPLFFLVFLLITMSLGLPFISIMYSFVAALGVCTVFSILYGRSVWGTKFFTLKPGGFRNDILAFSLPLLASAIIAMMLTWTDILMVGRYLAEGDVGTYNVGASMAKLLGFAANSLGFVFLPIASDLYARSRMQELKRSFQVLTKWVFAVTFPMFFILFFFPEMSVTFIFEQRYEPAAGPLSILCLGYLVYVFVGTSNTLLMAMGLTKQMMKISFTVMVINIILNYIFLKLMGYGIVGTAWATTISFFFYGLSNTVLLFRKSGIQPFTFNYTKPVLAAAFIGILIYALAKSIPMSFWILPFYFVLFVAGYAASILLTRSIEREDLDMLEAIGKRIGMDVGGLRRFLERFSL